MTYLAISIGAVLGANLRFLLGAWIAQRAGVGFPLGTLVINVTGSFLIGIVVVLVSERGSLPPWVQPMVAIGFLGSYTTFSTFSYETLALVQSGALLAGVGNVVVSFAASMAGVYLGTLVGRAA